MNDTRRPLLVYDGACGFCVTSLAWLQRRLTAWPATTAWQALTPGRLRGLGLTADDCQAAVQWVTGDGRVLSGHVALACLLHRQQRPWPMLAALAKAPLTGQIAAVAYRVIARNRHRLPGGTRECSIRQTRSDLTM